MRAKGVTSVAGKFKDRARRVADYVVIDVSLIMVLSITGIILQGTTAQATSTAPACPQSLLAVAYGFNAPFLALALFALAYLTWKAFPAMRRGVYVEGVEFPLFVAYFVGAMSVVDGASGGTFAVPYADLAGVMCVVNTSPVLPASIYALGVVLIALATLVIARIKHEEEGRTQS